MMPAMTGQIAKKCQVIIFSVNQTTHWTITKACLMSHTPEVELTHALHLPAILSRFCCHMVALHPFYVTKLTKSVTDDTAAA